MSRGDRAELVTKADELGGRYYDLPTDGSGLPADVVAAAKVFSAPHEKPTLVLCPDWVEPNRSAEDPSKFTQPGTFRAYVLNLGDRDTTNVKVSLRHPQDKGGKVFTSCVVPVIPKHNVATAAMPITPEWAGKSWKNWVVEAEAPGCEVIVYKH